MNSSLSTLAAAITLVACVQAQSGPSTTTPPYLVPAGAGVDFESILTVGDSVKKRHAGRDEYRMVGIPDGLGAFDNGDGTFTLLMNHELGSSEGVVRAHGGRGSFVSRWQIRKSDLEVLSGEDLIRRINLWNGASYVETAGVQLNRLCSADLALPGAYYNPASGLGFDDGLIFTNGEESGATGRAFAHVIQGVGNSASYELPAIGTSSWENIVASPYPQDRTVVAGLDDGSIGASKVVFYVGDKQSHGSPIEKAGLTGGSRYELRITGLATEAGIPAGDHAPRSFSLEAGGGTGFNRVEDGAWDTQDRDGFYFVTTASFTTNSRLWRVDFDDVTAPELGGTIHVVVDGILAGPKMMDNLTVDDDGKVVIQEDPGNQAYLARVWSYDPALGTLSHLASFDAVQFTAGASPPFITQDEESSGVIDVSSLLDGVPGYDTQSYSYYLLVAQVHRSIAAVEPELVQMGQLMLMRVVR